MLADAHLTLPLLQLPNKQQQPSCESCRPSLQDYVKFSVLQQHSMLLLMLSWVCADHVGLLGLH